MSAAIAGISPVPNVNSSYNVPDWPTTTWHIMQNLMFRDPKPPVLVDLNRP